MILWDIDSGERLRTFEGHDRGLACIEFKDDLIVSGSNDCKIKVWSASTGDCLRTLVGHDALVRALSFDPRSGRLVSASYDKSVKLWDLGSGKCFVIVLVSITDAMWPHYLLQVNSCANSNKPIQATSLMSSSTSRESLGMF
jgi:WD40 repeat protein